MKQEYVENALRLFGYNGCTEIACPRGYLVIASCAPRRTFGYLRKDRRFRISYERGIEDGQSFCAEVGEFPHSESARCHSVEAERPTGCSSGKNMAEGAMRFLAFISYKHGSDLPFSARLASALKSYAWPRLRLPPRIFRDEDQLVPSNKLPETIKAALRESEFLILLADPDAARSSWVQDELRFWCNELRRFDQLIVVLVKGKIAFDPATKRLDWAKTDALPKFLKSRMRSIPFFIDLSHVKTEPQLDLRDPEYKKAINSISARLRGVSPEDLSGEEIRMHRRARQVRNVVFVAMFFLLGLIAFLYQQSTSTLSEYERLADGRQLSNAKKEADALWPIRPSLIARLDEWRDKYSYLSGRLSSHKVALEEMRSGAKPYTGRDCEEDFRAEIENLRLADRDVKSIEAQLAGTRSVEERADEQEQIRVLTGNIERWKKIIDGRRTWRFDDVNLQFRHDALSQLVADITEFADPDRGLLSSIAKRRDLSKVVQDATIGQKWSEWEGAAERIRNNTVYKKLELVPQIGLIPLGQDPKSGLEEFLHWQSHVGNLPGRNENGDLERTSSTGIILVLVPAGRFWMGGQNQDENGRNFDPRARSNESPVKEIDLSAYFISKFEMTQGQWLRSTVEPNPSFHPPGLNKGSKQIVNLLHPVEQVSWFAADRLMTQLGLMLPTEAQWERAARAGSDTVYAGTSNEAELNRFANVAGDEAKEIWPSAAGKFRDDYVIHSEVGKFMPNGFGLFDMTGNVFEWCRDKFEDYSIEPRVGDGLRESLATEVVDRGGGFAYQVQVARIATRNKIDPSFREYSIGIRPARALENAN